MVSMLTGVTSPEMCGCPGRAAFTMVLERVGFSGGKPGAGKGRG